MAHRGLDAVAPAESKDLPGPLPLYGDGHVTAQLWVAEAAVKLLHHFQAGSNAALLPLHAPVLRVDERPFQMHAQQLRPGISSLVSLVRRHDAALDLRDGVRPRGSQKGRNPGVGQGAAHLPHRPGGLFKPEGAGGPPVDVDVYEARQNHLISEIPVRAVPGAVKPLDLPVLKLQKAVEFPIFQDDVF